MSQSAISLRKEKVATIYLYLAENGTYGATWEWGGTWDHAEPQDALLIIQEQMAQRSLWGRSGA